MVMLTYSIWRCSSIAFALSSHCLQTVITHQGWELTMKELWMSHSMHIIQKHFALKWCMMIFSVSITVYKNLHIYIETTSSYGDPCAALAKHLRIHARLRTTSNTVCVCELGKKVENAEKGLSSWRIWRLKKARNECFWNKWMCAVIWRLLSGSVLVL